MSPKSDPAGAGVGHSAGHLLHDAQVAAHDGQSLHGKILIGQVVDGALYLLIAAVGGDDALADDIRVEVYARPPLRQFQLWR